MQIRVSTLRRSGLLPFLIVTKCYINFDIPEGSDKNNFEKHKKKVSLVKNAL